MFTTAEKGYSRPLGAREDSPPEWVVTQFWPPLVPFSMPVGHSNAVKAKAEVDLSRWIVRCPWCPGAQLASETDPRFFCINCFNAEVGGKWITVEWPSNRAEIEEILIARPNPGNRIWFSHETAADLRRENAENLKGRR